MSDRFPGEITIGGPILTELLEPLMEAIQDQALSLEWDGANFEPTTAQELQDALQDDGTLLLMDNEASYGAFPDLEDFLVVHKIGFDRHSDAKWEHEAVLTRYRPHMDTPVDLPSNQSGELFVPTNAIHHAIHLLQRGRARQTIAFLQREAQTDIAPLPPLHTTDSGALRLPMPSLSTGPAAPPGS